MSRAKAKNNRNGNEPESLFVTGSRTKTSTLSRLEEYDEDPGRAGSKKYQRLANMLETCTTQEAAKSGVFLKEFRKEVKKKNGEIKKFRQLKEQELTKSREKTAAILRQIPQQFSESGDGQLRTLRKENHPLFKQIQANQEDHESLLKQIELVEEQLNANKLELPEAKWNQDKKDITEILGCGSRYGEALVGNVLVPSFTPSSVFGQPAAVEKDRIARELFKGNREALDGETWGHVAEEQLKQFSAIARTMQLGE
ncbi:hypothetical protein F4777DRAFT_549044 [Nemania sp. FL0916]|nr:hypothetical protein F4777DRAFT_549044 [Nemania sp. FL0916]